MSSAGSAARKPEFFWLLTILTTSHPGSKRRRSEPGAPEVRKSALIRATVPECAAVLQFFPLRIYNPGHTRGGARWNWALITSIDSTSVTDQHNNEYWSIPVSATTAEKNRAIAYGLSNNLARLLREFSRDFERRLWRELANRGYADLRPSHVAVFANLGMGAVRVTELAERAQVTQQAMGKMLKELERLGYISRDVDSSDKRARAIRLTQRGIHLSEDSLAVVAELRAQYAKKIGSARLDELEQRLRDAVGRLELEYLPESWTQSE